MAAKQTMPERFVVKRGVTMAFITDTEQYKCSDMANVVAMGTHSLRTFVIEMNS